MVAAPNTMHVIFKCIRVQDFICCIHLPFTLLITVNNPIFSHSIFFHVLQPLINLLFHSNVIGITFKLCSNPQFHSPCLSVILECVIAYEPGLVTIKYLGTGGSFTLLTVRALDRISALDGLQVRKGFQSINYPPPPLILRKRISYLHPRRLVTALVVDMVEAIFSFRSPP